ncbi:uncharacterized protein LOC132301003 [Cornus florida]|uniref:uncharacterized protein LOC132301003 n=1 Tax=Cornus florida TaxID=4283 RepID=UPI0028971EF9|nr:uncharacterized protein LOC132301003 [Cornus florida]
MKPAFSLKHLFSFFVFLFFSFHVTTGDTNHIPEACNICARDDSNPNAMLNFCTNSLQAVRGADRASRQELGKMTMKLLKNHANDTKSYIKQSLKEKKLDPNIKSSMNSCLAEYKARAKPSIDKALQAYKYGQYIDARFEITVFMKVTAACEVGFMQKNVASPFTKRIEDALQLSSLALCFIDKVIIR